MSERVKKPRPLTLRQTAALRCVVAEGGEASEEVICLEGISKPRQVCGNLVRKGFLERGDWLGTNDGYAYKLTESARVLAALIALSGTGKKRGEQ